MDRLDGREYNEVRLAIQKADDVDANDILGWALFRVLQHHPELYKAFEDFGMKPGMYSVRTRHGDLGYYHVLALFVGVAQDKPYTFGEALDNVAALRALPVESKED